MAVTKKATAKKATAKKATAKARTTKAVARKSPGKKKAVAKKAPIGAKRRSAAPTAPFGLTTFVSSKNAIVHAERVSTLAGGTRAAAELLGVDAAQASRWARGETTPSMDSARVLVDVDYVMSRASLVWASGRVIRDWLNTPNGHLDGVRPATWIREHGTAEVIAALDAELAGAYA